MIIYTTEVGGQNDEEPPDTKNQKVGVKSLCHMECMCRHNTHRWCIVFNIF